MRVSHIALLCFITFCCVKIIAFSVSVKDAQKLRLVLERICQFFYFSVPPNILDDYHTSTDMVEREGHNVSMHCQAAGSPKPTITWRREDGKNIRLGNGIDG